MIIMKTKKMLILKEWGYYKIKQKNQKKILNKDKEDTELTNLFNQYI